MGIGTHGLGRDRVDRKRVLAEHGVETWCQVGARHQLENVVGAIAQRDLVQLDTTALGQQAFQSEPIAIGVTGQLGQFVTDRRQCLGARAQRVFVARQLDDAGRIQVQLAGQFVHGFARNVRRVVARLAEPERGSCHSFAIRP